MPSVEAGRKKARDVVRWPQPRDMEDDNMSLATTHYNNWRGAAFMDPAWPEDGAGEYQSDARASGRQNEPVLWAQPRMTETDNMSLATMEYHRGPKDKNAGGTRAGPKRWTRHQATNIPPSSLSNAEKEAMVKLLPHVPPGYMIVKDPYAPKTIPGGRGSAHSVALDVLRDNLPPGFGIVKLDRLPARTDAGVRATAKSSAKKEELSPFRNLFFSGKVGKPSHEESVVSADMSAAQNAAAASRASEEQPSDDPVPFDSVRDLSQASQEIERVENAPIYHLDHNTKRKSSHEHQEADRMETEEESNMEPSIATKETGGQKVYNFNYYPVDANGKPVGCKSTFGSFDGRVLDLGYSQISIEDIEGADGTCCLIIEPRNEPCLHVLKICSGECTAQELSRRINQAASFRNGVRIMESFGGDGDPPVLAMCCTHCSSTVVVAESHGTPEIYCGYCKRVFLRSNDPNTAESAKMRVCDRCKFYGEVEDFKYNYAWGSIGCYGGVSVNWQTNMRHLCHACMWGKARKTCLVNTPCIVGIPSGLSTLADASRRQSLSSPDSQQIDRANAILNKEKKKKTRDDESIHEAMEIYRDIIRRREICAELHYNLGRAYLIRQDYEAATQSLEASLADCGNYEPAIDILMVCYGLSNANPAKALHLEERLAYSRTADFGEIVGHKRTRSSLGMCT